MICVKICINAGHTLTGKGSGAVGWLNESKENRRVVKYLIEYLEEKGHTVTEATVDKSSNYLKEVISEANKSGADLFLSVHFNAGKGRGTECYTWKGKKVSSAVKVCDNLSRLGFVNRGVKDGSGYYVIRKSKMTAVLIEVCFVDALDDIRLYKKHGAKGIAKAIAEAI